MPPAEIGCLACDLMSARRPLPGGRVYETQHWVVEHCIGPLPVGTLIVKPLRHCLTLADLTPAETAELGPLLSLTSNVVRRLTSADQVYACLWSHAGWTPGHIHFVLQPAWNTDCARHERPGPFMQATMFADGEIPDANERAKFAERAGATFMELANSAG
jgi:diadenosine tetraphosphate (Ap4A) HIT family hydrolase